MAPIRKDIRKGKVDVDSYEHAHVILDPLNLGRLVQTSKEKRLLLAFRNRTLTTPKYDNLSNFPANRFDLPTLFHFQGLGFVIANCGPFYPDLVKTFYCHLFIEPGYVVKYFVKGKDIVLTKEDFGKCLSIPFEGERVCQGFTCDWTNHEKNKYYFSISRLPEHEIFTNKARNYVRAPN